jgi:DNA-binding CsgD family transcriptional regulator
VSSVVGRESELTAVEAFLAAEGRRMLALLGEPGIGKTTLWQEAVALARSRGAVVLVARPARSEAGLSFAGLADLLSSVPAELVAALPAPQREGLDAALLRTAAARSPERRLVGTAFLTLLRTMAGEAMVVVAIDDVQWLDAPSAAVVEFALRRLADEPVAALVSVRSQDAERAPLLRLGRELGPQRLELGALSVAALHRVLAEHLGRTFPRPTLVRIAQASGGNPLYALEIARLLDRSGGADPTRMPVPTSLDALVRTRVRALPARTRSALLCASALARPDTRMVPASDLAAAEEADLVRIERDGRIHFVHPLFASAVYSAAPLSRRRETHRDLAAVVSDPEERARHLALASDGFDEVVVRELEAAAAHARRRGAPDIAAGLMELALPLVPAGSGTARRLQLELARHLYFASDFQRARALLVELRDVLEPGDLRSRALLTLAEIDYWRSGESAALVLAEEALAAAADPLQRARCQTEIAIYAGTVDLPRAAVAARAAVELLEARRDADPALVAAALAARVRADLFLGDGFDAAAAERALALEAPAPPAAVDGRVGFRLAQWLRYVDDLDGARARLEEAERQAREEGDESSLANILLNRLIVETWAGDWTEAAALTERMSDAFEQQGVELQGIAPWRAYLHAYAGRLEAVREVAGPRPVEPVIGAIWSRCVGLAELAAGDPQAADRHLGDALADFERVDFREPAVWRVEGDAIEAAVAAGALERARARLERFEEAAARSRIPWSLAVSARCRGLVLAAGGELDPAAEALERSLAEHERCAMPFERARTLLVQGQVLRRLKRKRQARASLEEARAAFGRLGADSWVDRADAELRRVAVRRAPDELSATELRIASLAAAGLTNQAIAGEVFLSRKAVEANLARVYRKLGIRSRAQLSRALEGLEPDYRTENRIEAGA